MSSDTSVKASHIYNEFYGLLAEHFPAHRTKTNAFDVALFGKDLGRSHETIYKALRRDKLNVTLAHSILEFSRTCDTANPLTWDDVARFVLPDFERLNDRDSVIDPDADEDDFDLDLDLDD